MQKQKIKRLWTALIGTVLFLLFWVSQTVRSTQLSYQIRQIESEIKKEQIKEVELMMKKDEVLSLEKIESAAKEKLGLIVPGEENIVVISLAER